MTYARSLLVSRAKEPPSDRHRAPRSPLRVQSFYRGLRAVRLPPAKSERRAARGRACVTAETGLGGEKMERRSERVRENGSESGLEREEVMNEEREG